MRSPFRSETDAYLFALLGAVAFAIVVAVTVLAGPWSGFAVGMLLTLVATAGWLRHGRVHRTLKTAPAHVGGPGERRIVAVAHEALNESTIAEIRRVSAGSSPRVMVVCPAPVSALRHWASDVDRGRERAQRTLEASIAALEEAGFECRGAVGDEDALSAIEDALREFGGDAIVIVGAGDGAAAEARARFALPVALVNDRAA